jgi:hypothetical protein
LRNYIFFPRSFEKLPDERISKNGSVVLYESFYLSTAQDKEKAKCPLESKVKWVN